MPESWEWRRFIAGLPPSLLPFGNGSMRPPVPPPLLPPEAVAWPLPLPPWYPKKFQKEDDSGCPAERAPPPSLLPLPLPTARDSGLPPPVTSPRPPLPPPPQAPPSRPEAGDVAPCGLLATLATPSDAKPPPWEAAAPPRPRPPAAPREPEDGGENEGGMGAKGRVD